MKHWKLERKRNLNDRFVLADRINRLPEQFFASLVANVQKRVRAGFDVINLGQGNPDLPTPPHVVEALRAAALDPMTHKYPPFTGLPALKRAVSEFYMREYGVKLNPDTEVAVLFGGKTGLVELSQIYLNHGDIALVPDPGYPDYWSGIQLAGGRMVTMPLVEYNAFLPDLSVISNEDANKARLMFLNYPNNPTGAVASHEFYEQVVLFAEKTNVIVIHDFAYGAIGFDGVKPPSFLQTEGARETGIEIYTLSKSFNMAGWRIAFAVGNEHVISHINLLQDHYYVSLFGAVQRAGIAALSSDKDILVNLRTTYEERRNVFIGELNRHGFDFGKPGGSFFCWLKVPQGYSSASFADFLLEQANVAVAPGIGFGKHGEGYVRVGLLAEQARLQEAANRIANAILRK
jgi:L-glutamine---4-(methylsulfanyl)-2-oxobutanoate aminotransferase